MRSVVDGDGKLEFAAIMRERTSRKIGVAIIHRSAGAIFIVGAGKAGIHGADPVVDWKQVSLVPATERQPTSG